MFGNTFNLRFWILNKFSVIYDKHLWPQRRPPMVEKGVFDRKMGCYISLRPGPIKAT